MELRIISMKVKGPPHDALGQLSEKLLIFICTHFIKKSAPNGDIDGEHGKGRTVTLHSFLYEGKSLNMSWPTRTYKIISEVTSGSHDLRVLVGTVVAQSRAPTLCCLHPHPHRTQQVPTR